MSNGSPRSVPSIASHIAFFLACLCAPFSGFADAAADEEPGRHSVVGRHGEIERIRESLTGVLERGSILVLEGEAGIGKTTLWRAAVEQARAASYRVLVARPGETETKPAYGALIDLFGEAPDEILDELPPPQKDALQAALLRGAGNVEHGTVAVAALNALRALAAQGPVIVAVDDFQWLDGPSKRVLLHVLRRLGPEPIGIVATERPPTAILGAPEERVTRMHIGPLSVGGLHHLVRSRLGLSLARPLLVRVANASGGNPLYALEIVRSLEADGFDLPAGSALPIPSGLRALVSHRLARLPASAREAVVVTYRLSRPTPGLVERALQVGGHSPEGLTLAAEAEALELGADTVRLAHPLLGSVLYQRLAPSERRALHARLASLPLDPEARAYERALAAEGPDEEAASYAEAIAAEASARGAPETAAELLDLAVARTSPADAEAKVRRLDRSAMAHFLAGGSAKAVDQWEEIARTAPPGVIRAHSMWRLAEFGSSSVPGGFEGVPELLESIMGEAKGDLSLRAHIEASLAEFLIYGSGPLAAEPHARAALRLAERDGDRRALAHALVSRALTDLYLGRGTPFALLDRAIAIESDGLGIQTEILPSAYLATWVGLTNDEPGRAAALLDEKLDQAVRHHDESSMPFLLWQRCEVAVSQGHLEAAASYAARCHDAVEASGRLGRRGGALYCQALVDAYRGRTDEALDLARRALERDEPRGVLFTVSLCRGVIGFIELSLDRFEAVVEWLAPTCEALFASGTREPGLYRFLPDYVEALVQLGRFDEARRVLDPFQRAALRLERRWAIGASSRCRGLLFAATGDADGGVEMLAEAVGVYSGVGQPFELARTQLALGAVARRARRKTVAKESLEAALRLFEQLGSPLWAERARQELARVGVRPSAGLGLTETERRIAELVAVGHSNPEIAARLFMSRKTVEAHLSAVYRKLGIRSRAELAARAASLEQPPPSEEQT